MILVDANLLIYAIDSDSPHHRVARRWLEEMLSGDQWIGLPWIVVLAFLRIVTHPAIVRRPLPAEDALAYVEGWLAQPRLQLVGPGEHHWSILSSLLRTTGTAGNLTSDAHIAALAVEHGCTVASADNDFRRFAGVRHLNPLG
jgi:hypothetical protein